MASSRMFPGAPREQLMRVPLSVPKERLFFPSILIGSCMILRLCLTNGWPVPQTGVGGAGRTLPMSNDHCASPEQFYLEISTSSFPDLSLENSSHLS